jgi:hypothetical protein
VHRGVSGPRVSGLFKPFKRFEFHGACAENLQVLAFDEPCLALVPKTVAFLARAIWV